MRNFALLLVLTNLAFAAWHHWFAASSPAPVSLSADAPGITLVSELAPPAAAIVPAPAPAEMPADTEVQPPEAPVEATPEPLLRCLSVGPFRELSQAAGAAASLRAAGYEPAQRVTEGDIWVGYWVYLAGIPTRAQANDVLASVQAIGIADAYVTPGDDGFLISLGVFSEVSRAGRRREEVRALGQEPIVVDRTRRGTVYWIDLRLPEGQMVDLDSLRTPGRIIRLEQRACEPA